MVLPVPPDTPRGWMGQLWPILQSASPLTVALVLVLWYLSMRWGSTELTRVHTVNQALWERLLQAQQAQTELAWRCTQGSPESR